MTLKRVFLIIAAVSLAIAILGWFAWGWVLKTGPGEHGENWTLWDNTIGVIWTIIPIAFGVCVITALISAALPPRNRRGLVIAFSIFGVAAAVACFFAFVLANLKIR